MRYRVQSRAAVAVSAMLVAAAVQIGPAAGNEEAGTAAPLGLSLEVPEGWQRDVVESERLQNNARMTGFFAGADVAVRGEMWKLADPPVALFVTWGLYRQASSGPEKTIRALFDRVVAAPKSAGMTADEITQVSWNESIAENAADGRLEWRHLPNQTSTVTRVLAFADSAGRLHVGRAECLFATDSDAQARPHCQRALDSLAVTVPAAERRALTALPGAADAQDEPAPAVEPPSGGGDDPLPSLRTATIGKPDLSEDAILLVNNEKRSAEGSNKWLFFGGGLLLLLAIYFTTRNQKSDDREEETSAETQGDADADSQGDADADSQGDADAESDSDEKD